MPLKVDATQGRPPTLQQQQASSSKGTEEVQATSKGTIDLGAAVLLHHRAIVGCLPSLLGTERNVMTVVEQCVHVTVR